MSRLFLSAFVLFLCFSSMGISQPGDLPPTTWMERSDEGLKLLFSGKVTHAGGPISVARMQVIDRPDPLADKPRIRDVQSLHGSFAFDSIGLGMLVVWATNEDGTQQALETIAMHDVAAAARSGIEMQLEPAHLLAVRVLNQKQPVVDAQVLVRIDCGLEVDGHTGNDGIARIYLPNGQIPSYIRAWTPEKKIGSVDFRNASVAVRRKTLHTVELTECKPLTVRVVDEAGTRHSELPIRLGVSDSKHEWMIDTNLFEAVTDQNGEATFDYFPDWEDERHFLYADVSGRFIERKPEVIDGVNVYTLRFYEPAHKTRYQLTLPEQCPGGMLVEGYSFQSKQEDRSTIFFSRVDAEGRFEAPVVPGYTYDLCIQDGESVAGVAAADGKFEAQVDAARGYAYAATADGNYSGATKFTSSENRIEIELLKVGQVGGRVYDDQGIPIEGGRVFVSATIKPFEKPDDVGDNWPMDINIARLETRTDKDGKFLFEQLPAQVRVLIGLDTQHLERGTFRRLDEVFLEPGESRLDNVYRPKAKNDQNVEDRFSKLLRNCQCIHTHGLVLVGGNEKAVEHLRREALDYDEHADVLWYLPFMIDVTSGVESADVNFDQKRKLLERRKWGLPSQSELLLVAVDAEGNELGQLVLSSEMPMQTASQSIAEFLAQHRIKQQDAREKLADAVAEAKRTGRRVWARVGGTRCGPCISMFNWLEDHRTFIERAFVLCLSCSATSCP